MATPLIGIDLGGVNCGAIHQDRLVLAGSTTISDLVMASTVGDHTDFRLGSTTPLTARAAGDGLPAITQEEAEASVDENGDPKPIINPESPLQWTDAQGDMHDLSWSSTPADGFWFQQTSSRQNSFHFIIQQEGMFIFGDLGEATVPSGAGGAAAFIPDNVVIRENSWYGTELGRTVLIVGGLVVFIQKGGQDVRGIEWSEERSKYDAPSLITLAGNLFDRAVDMSFAPSKDRRSDTVYVIGESNNVELDGQLGVLLLRYGDPRFAWARWRTVGKILGGAAPLGHRVFLVERGGDPASAVEGTVALETLAPDGTDDLDAAYGMDVVVSRTDNDIPILAYGPLPDTAAWMDGLTDLDGLIVWLVDEDGETITAVGRQETINRNQLSGVNAVRGAADPADQVDKPVIRVRGNVVESLHPDESGMPVIWRPLRPGVRDPTDEEVATGEVKQRGRVGLSYERSVETLPYVARKSTGTSSRVRPFRMMDCNVDVILPAGFQLDEAFGADLQTERIEELVRAGEIDITVTGSYRGRRRERSIRSPKARFLDTLRLIRVRSGPRSGYRDRLGIRITSTRHVELAGLSYRVTG